MKIQIYEALAGDHIQTACKEAVELAKRDSCNVEFAFNDQTLTATPDTDPSELANAYSRESERRHKEHIASPEYKRQQEECQRKEREKQGKVAGLLKDAPEHMTLRDAEAWQRSCDANKDAYGGAVMTYAERWARLMEARMGKGEKLESIADDCSRLADLEGITGFMYGCAVSILAQVWQHGEELRRWHNLKTQLRGEGERANEEGGVLNPALLSIG